MTNNEVLRVIDSVLFDLDTNALDKAKSTLKTLQSLLKRQNELNEFKRIVYDKMLFYHSRDKAKNKKVTLLFLHLGFLLERLVLGG